MKKISEVTSKKDYTLEILGEQLPLTSFHAGVMRDMEKDGINPNELFSDMTDYPTTSSITFLWYLLTKESKAFFENSIEVLFENIGPKELDVVSKVITTIYQDGQPIGKKSEDVPV
ncbi:MAG: hypothetical protein NTV01_01815 [Bacteroidia bacterium]|nr:hypothetical protein [Bacteroidia bacterium]